MRDDLKKVAAGIGELYAAAMHDYQIASWNDVGLHGVPIKVWREAYAEGCKDMATAVGARLDDADKDDFKAEVLAAIKQHAPEPAAT